MTSSPACPRCLSELRPPDARTGRWQCPVHGEVAPYRIADEAPDEMLDMLRLEAMVPVWAPVPPPIGWTASAVGWAGDEPGGPTGTAVAVSGPSPLGGPADLVLVAEEPGVGLGARLAGQPDADPDPWDTADAPSAKVTAAGHPTPLWTVPGPDDRAAWVGEARGVWLWVVLWPADAAVLLMEDLILRDLRDGDRDADPPLTVEFGARSPRLG
ncbi:MAG: DUF6758 family protein [Frankia sp.]